jgi:hypothetical protein
MRALIGACALAAIGAFSGVAAAQPSAPAPAAAAAPAYSTSTTLIGELLSNPALKEIFVREFPDLANNPGLSQASGQTLRSIQSYVPAMTEAKLAEMDAALAQVPASTSAH